MCNGIERPLMVHTFRFFLMHVDNEKNSESISPPKVSLVRLETEETDSHEIKRP